MGGGQSNTRTSSAAQKTINKKIEQKMIARTVKESQVIKVILLGAGECGKSTILKQMKLLHMNGFSEDEVKEMNALVYKNTLDSIQSLCGAMTDLNIQYEDPANVERAATIMAVDASNRIDHNALKDVIIALWADKGIQTARSRENEFHLLDSAPYFLDRVGEYFVDSFQASTQDMLRTRLTTTGIIETQFSLDGMDFKMFDVGGQRGERKKWIHCFDDVTAIMFIASLSEYNQVLAEDRTKNRMTESLQLFENIINLPWFDEAKVILFLNKNDLFEEKIKKVDIKDFHPDYDGGCDYNNGIEWIKGEYTDRNDDEDKTIYTHVTDATNTENVAFVWKAANHILISNNLKASGLSME